MEGQVVNFPRTSQPYAPGPNEAVHDEPPLPVEQTVDLFATVAPAMTSYPVTPEAGEGSQVNVTDPGGTLALTGVFGVAGVVGHPCASTRETAPAAQTSSIAKRLFIGATF